MPLLGLNACAPASSLLRRCTVVRNEDPCKVFKDQEFLSPVVCPDDTGWLRWYGYIKACDLSLLWAQVRAKTFVAVGHETANKGEHGKNLRRDTMDANLLANMELGVHSDAAPGRQTSDLVSTPARLHSPVVHLACSRCACGYVAPCGTLLEAAGNIPLCCGPLSTAVTVQDGRSGPYRTTTDEADGFYRTAKDPLEVDEDGMEMSSAPVAFGQKSKHGKDVVRRTDSDQEQGLPPGAPSPVSFKLCSSSFWRKEAWT